MVVLATARSTGESEVWGETFEPSILRSDSLKVLLLSVTVTKRASQGPFPPDRASWSHTSGIVRRWAFQRTVRTLLDLGTGWYGNKRCENLTHRTSLPE